MRYSLVAVDFLPPPVINRTLAKVARQLAEGVLRPLRHITHSVGGVAGVEEGPLVGRVPCGPGAMRERTEPSCLRPCG